MYMYAYIIYNIYIIYITTSYIRILQFNYLLFPSSMSEGSVYDF